MNTTQCPACLSTHVGALEADQTIDCLDCGLWWQATHPNNQPGAAAYGRPIQPGDLDNVADEEDPCSV